MSYRCSVCQGVSPPGQGRIIHRLVRPDGQTEAEVPVCRDCRDALEAGIGLAELRCKHGKEKPGAVSPAAIREVSGPVPTNVRVSNCWKGDS